MRQMLSAILFFVAGLARGATPLPSIVVVSELMCGADRLGVLQVSNQHGSGSLLFPLSPYYQLGYTIYDMRLEVFKGGRWQAIGRGSDISSSGVREVKPGESFIDFFELPTSDRVPALVGLPKRVSVPYLFRKAREEAKTREFDDSKLPTDNSVRCPSAFHAR